MKKFIILIFLAVCISTIYTQPWQEQVSGVTTQLTGVSAMDNLNAWICGYSGVVLRTTNTGTNWQNVSGNGIPATMQLINIWGIDPNTAITAGYIGSNTWVYRTTNAGANWVQVFTQTGGFINAVSIRMNGTGFMMGDPVGGRWSMWKTTNGGANWDSTGLYLVQTGTETGFNNCMTVALNKIWFGTNNSRIYYSTNDGTNWSTQSAGAETQIGAIWFDENGSSTGYCGGNVVYKTTDYGSNWTSIGGPGTGLIVGVAGLSMWGGNLWYVRSGSPVIYFGYGTGVWFTSYTAPAGTNRHVTTDRVPNYPFLGYAVRSNGGIAFTWVFVEAVNNLGGEIPNSYSLSQNYPNPFNPVTKIRFNIPSTVERGTENAKLVIFDMLGREMTTLVNEKLMPGAYEVDWDASAYPSGVYFYRLQTESFTKTLRMALLK
jgi:photosystem II stability/assembly factor-like uncharacterized protein